MSLCKSGQIQNCCHPNALMTLAEYMTDYASPATRSEGMALIERDLESIPDATVRKIAAGHIRDIVDHGVRDFRF